MSVLSFEAPDALVVKLCGVGLPVSRGKARVFWFSLASVGCSTATGWRNGRIFGTLGA